MSRPLPNALFALALLLLQACSLQPAQPPVPAEAAHLSWPHYLEQQQQHDRWAIQGKLGVRYGSEHSSATLSWQQHQQRYRLYLSGPLGQGAVTIEGEPGYIELTNSDGQHSASTPEELLGRQLGWELPLSSAPFWIRGIPAPGATFTADFNDDQRLATLQQAGWTIAYPQYQQFEAGYLPRKLVLSRPDLRITVIIKEWVASR